MKKVFILIVLLIVSLSSCKSKIQQLAEEFDDIERAERLRISSEDLARAQEISKQIDIQKELEKKIIKK